VWYGRDGASCSGLVCALSYAIEMLKVEQEVDVFQAVKHIRINRPQLIPTFVHSRFTYLIDCNRLLTTLSLSVSTIESKMLSNKSSTTTIVCLVLHLGLPLTSSLLLEYSSEYLNGYSSTR